jgi:hypothetical protein
MVVLPFLIASTVLLLLLSNRKLPPKLSTPLKNQITKKQKSQLQRTFPLHSCAALLDGRPFEAAAAAAKPKRASWYCNPLYKWWSLLTAQTDKR